MNKLFAVLFLLLFPIGHIMSQAPVVTSISPVKQVINAPRGTSVTVNFNSPVNTSTVNSTTFRVFGKLSGPVPGTFEFLNGNQELPNTEFMLSFFHQIAKFSFYNELNDACKKNEGASIEKLMADKNYKAIVSNLLEEKGLYFAMWRQQIGERKPKISVA